MPGVICVSIGLYNEMNEVDWLSEALQQVLRGEYRGKYQQDRATGEYKSVGWEPKYERYFSLPINSSIVT